MFTKFKQIIIAILATAFIVAAFILMITYPAVSFTILAVIGVILIFMIFYNTAGEVLNHRETEAENNNKAYDSYKSTSTESKDIICLKAKSLFSKKDISELNLTEEDMMNVTKERIMKSLIEQLDNYNCFEYEFVTNSDESMTVALTLYAVGNKK